MCARLIRCVINGSRHIEPLNLRATSATVCFSRNSRQRRKKGRELEELDEEPELSELKVVESEDIEAGATASGEAASGGLSAYFRRDVLFTSIISAVSAGSSSSKVREVAFYVILEEPPRLRTCSRAVVASIE